ncbi:hypothetical protein ILUMI_23390, partial [Ignelater luminosus]
REPSTASTKASTTTTTEITTESSTDTAEATTATTTESTTKSSSTTTEAATTTTTKSTVKSTTTTTTLSTTKHSIEPGESVCYNKPVRVTLCPDGFNSSKLEDVEFCIWSKEKQTFPPTCPYPHPLAYEYAKRLIPKFLPGKTVWLNVLKNTSSGFPDFEWLENGLYYGKPIVENVSNLEDGFGKDCLVVRDNIIFRVKCSERHATICVYAYSSLKLSTADRACNMKGYHSCILANYNLRQQTCFCRKIIEPTPDKRQFCEKLIEPLPFQSEMLAVRYNDNYSCWMGLYKDEHSADVYRWLSTKAVVTYTRWVRNHDCKYSEGAYQFKPQHSQSGWVLLKDRTLNCALCEVSLHYEQPSLQLQYIQSKNILQLLISNPKAISNLGYTSSSFYDIYCFTDRHSEGFKDILETHIKAPSVSDNQLTHDILLNGNHPSYYWCEGFQYASFKPVKSNVIIALRRTEYYGHEFSLQVNFKFNTKYDPVSNKIYVDICQRIEKNITESWNHLLALRPMRGYLKEKGNMDILIHITTNNTFQTATDQHITLTEIIESIQIPQIQLSELRSSEICLFNISLSIDKEILEWPETRIGSTAIPSNILCLDEENNMLPVTRDCLGDFLFGARWSEPKGNCYANTSHSEISEELFNLTKNNVPAKNITEALERITKNTSDIQVIDIHLIATLLEKLETSEENDTSNSNYVGIVNNIMNFDRKDLREAQLLLNSTDKILSVLDDTLQGENETSITSQKLLVEIINIADESIIGFTLHKKDHEANSFEQYQVSLLFQNVSIDNLTKDENLEIAVFLPLHAKEKINISETPIKLITTIFYNDFLFNSNENSQTNKKNCQSRHIWLYWFS